MDNRVFSSELISQVASDLQIADLAKATIGQMVLVSSQLHKRTGIPFVRMDQGVPGLEPNKIGRQAEKEALDTNIAAIYPAAEGIEVLKSEASRFVKAFMDVDISPKGCLPTTGSVASSFGAFIVCSQLDKRRNKILFIDPGFPIQKSQLRILGIDWEQFDIYNYRGEALRERLEGFLKNGDIAAVIYSNPNNPAWICLEESELKIIGDLATKYDTIILEDLAYFAMDFRRELGRPFQAPYQPTVAKYTDNYMLMLSASKIFSYAGQRSAVMCISDKLYNRVYPSLAERYGTSGHFGITFTNAIMYMITSGSTHSTQFGLAAMYKAASDGQLDFRADTKEYARRAEKMKQILVDNGFYVVYDKDIEDKISDGFFFTMGYPNMSSAELMRELLYYGISSITLTTTGSEQQGVRACTSRMDDEMIALFKERLEYFKKDHTK